MAWEVEFTDEFEKWRNSLNETEQIKIDAAVRMLEEYGPDLPYPMSSGVNGSRHSHIANFVSKFTGIRSEYCMRSTQDAP